LTSDGRPSALRLIRPSRLVGWGGGAPGGAQGLAPGARYRSSQAIPNTPWHFGHARSAGWPFIGARALHTGHTTYLSPQPLGTLRASRGRGTMDQRNGRRKTVSSRRRGTGTGSGVTSRTASAPVTWTTRYHPPRRSPQFTSTRRRAQATGNSWMGRSMPVYIGHATPDGRDRGYGRAGRAACAVLWSQVGA